MGGRAGVFAPDILGRKLDVKQCGVNLGVPHEVLESRQGDASPHHIRPESMTESMGVRGPDFAAPSMMAKE